MIKIITTLFLFIFLSLPVTLHNPAAINKLSVGKRISLKKSALMDVQKALAATTLDPATMNLGTPAGRADFVRFLYFMVVGPSSDYVIPNGPEGGLVGVIRQIMGADGLGGMMYRLGHTTCEAIPTTGSSNVVTEEGDNVLFTYAAGAKTIPARYGAHAGGSFAKSVKISINAVDMLKSEFNCEAGGLVSGYVRMQAGEEDRHMEVYFLRDEPNQDGYLDFYMVANDASYNEKAAVQFTTLDDTIYDLFLVRNQDNTAGNDEGSSIGLKGDINSGLVQVHYIFDNNDAVLNNNTAIGAAGITECIALATNTVSGGCAAISAPTNVTLGGPAFTWTILSLTSLSLTAF